MKTTQYRCAACGRDFERSITVRCEYGVFEACPHCGCWDYEEYSKTVMYRDELKQYRMIRREVQKLEDALLVKRTPEREEAYENRRMRCIALRLKLESFIFGIDDSRLRQIFTARYVKGLSWGGVAAELGGYCSADALRLAHDRYLKSLEKSL